MEPTARPRAGSVREYICPLCISVMVRTPCPVYRHNQSGEPLRRDDTNERERVIYVFPAECGAAFDTVDITDSVVASRHRAVIWLSLDNINTGEEEWE